MTHTWNSNSRIVTYTVDSYYFKTLSTSGPSLLNIKEVIATAKTTISEKKQYFSHFVGNKIHLTYFVCV